MSEQGSPALPDSLAGPAAAAAAPGARRALALLLAINMFNYIDRYVLAAVESPIQKQFFPNNPPNAEALMGSLATAFIVSYLVMAPIFGWLADRMSRWLLVGASVILWSIASGASGLAGFFTMLLVTRLFVGVGEAGYGPAAPTIISDLCPLARRGTVLAWFYAAIPVGSALGYGIGGGLAAAAHNWRVPFFVVAAPGLLLGALCFVMRDPPRGQCDAATDEDRRHQATKAQLADYLVLLKTPSYVLNTLGQAAMTFAIGGISFWIPKYFVDHRQAGGLGRVNLIFSAIVVVAGFTSTLAGGWAGDRLRARMAGSYFIVSAVGILMACPFILAMVYAPLPWAWAMCFAAVFCLFFNTGPSNTILANVTHPSVRATGFALNICAIHILGDAVSPPLLGWVAHTSWDAAFAIVAAVTALAGVLWLWGARYLQRDTALAPLRLAQRPAFPVSTKPV